MWKMRESGKKCKFPEREDVLNLKDVR